MSISLPPKAAALILGGPPAQIKAAQRFDSTHPLWNATVVGAESVGDTLTATLQTADGRDRVTLIQRPNREPVLQGGIYTGRSATAADIAAATTALALHLEEERVAAEQHARTGGEIGFLLLMGGPPTDATRASLDKIGKLIDAGPSGRGAAFKGAAGAALDRLNGVPALAAPAAERAAVAARTVPALVPAEPDGARGERYLKESSEIRGIHRPGTFEHGAAAHALAMDYGYGKDPLADVASKGFPGAADTSRFVFDAADVAGLSRVAAAVLFGTIAGVVKASAAAAPHAIEEGTARLTALCDRLGITPESRRLFAASFISGDFNVAHDAARIASRAASSAHYVVSCLVRNLAHPGEGETAASYANYRGFMTAYADARAQLLPPGGLAALVPGLNARYPIMA